MSTPKKSKRFNYNLESVLKVRDIREKQEQEKFLAAEQKFMEEERKEEEIKSFQNQKYRELRTLMEPGAKISDFQEVLMRNSHLDIVKTQVEEQERAKKEAEKLKEAQRETLIKAVKDRKIMEKDKENKKESWRKVMDKEQGKFLDDIATIGFSRKKRDQ
jgi:flagellar protein FliJ